MSDPYTDPRTGVLHNVLGIHDPLRLRQAESGISAAAIADLETRRLPGSYDLAHLTDFHREIFRDVYPWAGEIRTVAIAKSDLFCLPQFIAGFAAEVFGQLARERHLRGLGKDDFADRLTHFYAEVNAVHPFREGNGRTQRAFFGQLARDAGWAIRWARLDPDRNESTSRAALRGDNRPLRAMFEELVDTP